MQLSVLVTNRNLGPILPRFRDIAGFLLRTVNVSDSSHIPPDFGSPKSEDPKLIRVSFFEVTQLSVFSKFRRL